MHSELPALFSGVEEIQERAGQVFLQFGDGDPQSIAQAFKRMGARFVTLTLLEMDLVYIYELAGRLYWVQLPVITPVRSIGAVFAGARPCEAYVNAVYGLAFDPAPDSYFIHERSAAELNG